MGFSSVSCPFTIFLLVLFSFFPPVHHTISFLHLSYILNISISQAGLWDIVTGIPLVIGTYTGGRRPTTVGVSPSRTGASSKIITVFFRVGVTWSCGNPSFPLSYILFFSFLFYYYYLILLHNKFRFFPCIHICCDQTWDICHIDLLYLHLF